MWATLLWFILIKIILLPFLILWYFARKKALHPVQVPRLQGSKAADSRRGGGAASRAGQDPDR